MTVDLCSWALPNIISDRPFYDRGTTKTDPSIHSTDVLDVHVSFGYPVSFELFESVTNSSLHMPLHKQVHQVRL